MLVSTSRGGNVFRLNVPAAQARVWTQSFIRLAARRQPPTPASDGRSSRLDQLERLAALYKEGALTDVEFASEKHRLIASAIDAPSTGQRSPTLSPGAAPCRGSGRQVVGGGNPSSVTCRICGKRVKVTEQQRLRRHQGDRSNS